MADSPIDPSTASTSAAALPAAQAPDPPILAMMINAFGPKRVVHRTDRAEIRLYHESTEHGRQSSDPAWLDEPLGYFHRQGPLGDALTALAAPGALAIIGLGVGAAAAYGRADQRMLFLELDPAMVVIAERHFHYLRRSKAAIEVRVGDGRALLEAAAGERFQIILLDAYDDGEVPPHLLDEGALHLYLQRLAPGGALLFHATQGQDGLLPVLAGHAKAMGLSLLTRRLDVADEEAQGEQRQTCRYVALARSDSDLAALAARPGWTGRT